MKVKENGVWYMVITEGNEHESEPIPEVTDSWFEAVEMMDESFEYGYVSACLVIEFVDGKAVNAVRYNKGDNTPHYVF